LSVKKFDFVETLEVANVESEQVPKAMPQHRGNETRIVAIFALNTMLPREVAPDP
jgi:hypothetical protein